LSAISRNGLRPWLSALLSAAVLVLLPAPVAAAEATKASDNWAADAELEGIVDLLDPDYQKQPINVGRLPVRYAVKTVYGRGTRTVYTFEDPNCGYCRQLHRTLKEIGDLTVYTFVVTFLGEDSVGKAHAVWCAKDRAAAWNRVMAKETVPAAPAGCTAPVNEVKKLIGLLGINLTPTVFYADGQRMNGVRPREEILRRLTAASR
jgi:thiol:disulfide interchange protein DsbC